MYCETCEKEFATIEIAEYDYTTQAGLDPERHQVILGDIEGYECGCGVTPIIPNLEGLHFTIGLMIIREESPIDGTAIRFMRKTLGLTQRQLADAIEVHEQTISKWERGAVIPERSVRVHAATVFLSQLMTREEVLESMKTDFVSETLNYLVSRNRDSQMPPRTRIEVDSRTAPPAWMIAELERNGPDTGSGRRGGE